MIVITFDVSYSFTVCNIVACHKNPLFDWKISQTHSNEIIQADSIEAKNFYEPRVLVNGE